MLQRAAELDSKPAAVRLVVRRLAFGLEPDAALDTLVAAVREMLAKEGKGAGAVASIQAARPQARAKAEAAPAPPQAAAAERGHTRRTHAKSRDKPGKRRPGTRGTTS